MNASDKSKFIGNVNEDGYYDTYYYEYNLHYDLQPLAVIPEVHPASKVILCIVYSLMMPICGVGNAMLMYVLLRHRKMRTVPNLLVANLAASDFLVAVFCAPFNLTYYIKQNWAFGEDMCVAAAYIKLVSLYVSTNSLLVIAIDRYIVIVNPLKPRMRAMAACIAIVAIWAISATIVMPTAMFTKTIQFWDNGVMMYYCGEFWKQSDIVALKAYNVFLLIGEYVAPLGLMAFFYTSISRQLWQHRFTPTVVRQPHNVPNCNADSTKKTIRLLVILVVIFALSWLPYYSYTVYRDFFPLLHHDFVHSISIFYVVESIAMSNSMVNTIVYVLLNDNVRRKIRQIPIDFRRLREKRRRQRVVPNIQFIEQPNANQNQT
ncbi:prokineticin receptor 2-like [Ptychodera flava]|uniref:prokineticin receptor 2-like n=1 Tax=Ptychodera flava TaxID=63121 RepID=UPI00396A57FB